MGKIKTSGYSQPAITGLFGSYLSAVILLQIPKLFDVIGFWQGITLLIPGLYLAVYSIRKLYVAYSLYQEQWAVVRLLRQEVHNLRDLKFEEVYGLRLADVRRELESIKSFFAEVNLLWDNDVQQLLRQLVHGS